MLNYIEGFLLKPKYAVTVGMLIPVLSHLFTGIIIQLILIPIIILRLCKSRRGWCYQNESV